MPDNKKEQEQFPAHTYQTGIKRQKEIECPHPTLRLVKNTRYVLGRQRDSEMCIPHGFTHNKPLKLKAVRTFALQQFLLCR